MSPIIKRPYNTRARLYQSKYRVATPRRLWSADLFFRRWIRTAFGV